MTNTELKKVSRSVSFGVDWINGHINTADVLGFFRQLESISPKLAFDRWELCPQGIYNYSRRYRWHDNGQKGLAKACAQLGRKADAVGKIRLSRRYVLQGNGVCKVCP